MNQRDVQSWLHNLVYHNYGYEVDFHKYNLGNPPYHIDLHNSHPQQLFKNIVLLINSYTEYNSTHKDHYKRYPYLKSIQHRENILQENVVQDLISKILKYERIELTDQPSHMIISHDIDSLHNGFLRELYHGIRRCDFPLIYRVLSAFAAKKPFWWNLDEILEMLERYDFKSIFYFIVRQGRSTDGIKNADYNIKDLRIQQFIDQALRSGHEVGLHKSSFDQSSLKDEIGDLGVFTASNRHHFIRFRLPQLYKDLDVSKIKTDSSLVFPYHMGFRNSYGLPFQPLDLTTGKTLNVLEIPFQIMDGMFNYRNKSEGEYASKTIIDFIEKHKYNATLGMLWHNTDLNSLSKIYSLETFKSILKYLHESEIKVVTPHQVYKRYFKLN